MVSTYVVRPLTRMAPHSCRRGHDDVLVVAGDPYTVVLNVLPSQIRAKGLVTLVRCGGARADVAVRPKQTFSGRKMRKMPIPLLGIQWLGSLSAAAPLRLAHHHGPAHLLSPLLLGVRA